MTPYQDADLAALALQRGVVRLPDLRRAAEGATLAAGGGRGALARSLLQLGLVDRPQLEGLLRELAGGVRACPGCGQTHAALAWPASARRVVCPACGVAEVLPADPQGVPPAPPGWNEPASDALGPPTRRLPEEPSGERGSGRVDTRRAPGSHTRGAGASASRSASGRAQGPGGTWYDPQAARAGGPAQSARAGGPASSARAGGPAQSARAGGPPHARASSARLREPGSDAVSATRHDASSHAGPRSSARLGQREREALAPGALVGPYVIESEISRGAMGIVLRAHHHTIPERVVALKVMKTDLEGDQESMERFRREGVALARLEHMNVVRVHDADFTAEGHPYLAMDYVEGLTLEQLLRSEGPLPLERAARIMEAVARGVAHLHERAIVHRDLKLGNVLLDPEGRPRIADFGLAYLQDRRTRLTMAGDLLGTPLYMAPEAIAPGGLELDGRADVYALGVMLWRLLTNTYPFHAEVPALLFEQVLQAPLRFPAQPALTSDTQAVLSRALARERTRRYPTAEALAADLQALAEGRPVAARSRRPLERVLAWGRTQRLALGGALAGALLVAGLLGWLGSAGQDARRETLETLAARLESEAGRLEEGRELTAVDLRRVEEELVRAAARLDEGEAAPEALGLVRAAARRLSGQLALARAREALRGARAAGSGPAAVASALGALEAARSDLARAGLEPAPWLELERARALGELGRLEEALEALRSAGPAASDDLLGAWSRLRLGRGDAEDPLVTRPADLAQLVLARAALAPPEEAGPLLARARALLDGLPAGPAVELGRREAELIEARGDPVRLRALLAPLQALETSGEPARRGRAGLLRAQVLVALGHPASAERAAAGALTALPPATYPALVLALGADGPGEGSGVASGRLVAPRLAAALLRARAASELPDGQAAQAAAQAALELAGPDGLGRLEAALLLAEVRQLLPHGDAGSFEQAERELLAAAGQAGPAGAPWVAAARGRISRRAGRLAAGEGQAAGLAPAAAVRCVARAEALLARLEAAELARPPGAAGAADGSSGDAQAARRSALLALGLSEEPALRARAHLAAVRAALRLGRLEEARGWLEQVDREAGGWRLAAARGELSLREGDARGAGLAWREAMEALARGRGRPLQRAAHAAWLCERAVTALSRQAPPQALAIQSLAVDLAEEVRLPLPLRERWLAEARRLALEVSGPEVAELWDARLKEQLLPEFDAYNQLGARVAEERRKIVAGHTGDGLWAAQKAFLDRFPAEARAYANYYGSTSNLAAAGGDELKWRAYDALALAFELRPLPVLVNLGIQRLSSDRSVVGGDLARAARWRLLERVLSDDAPDPALTPRDDHLRLALVGGSAIEVLGAVPPGTMERCLDAAWAYALERPGELPAALVLGRLLVAAGDPLEARRALSGLESARLPFEPIGPGERAWAYMTDALAAAALGDREAAQQQIERAAADALDWQAKRGGEGLDPRWLQALGERIHGETTLLGLGGAAAAERLGARPR